MVEFRHTFSLPLIFSNILLLLVFSHHVFSSEEVFHNDDECSWSFDILKVHKSGTLERVDRVNTRETLVLVSKLLSPEAYKVFSSKGSLLAYRYLLRFGISCNQKYSSKQTLALAEEDVALYVHITQSAITIDANHTGPVKNTFKAALTDNSLLTGKRMTCNKLLCEPVWISPFPLAEKSVYLEIATELNSNNIYIPPIKKFVLLNPFFAEGYVFGKVTDISKNMVDNLINKGVHVFVTSPRLTVMDMLTIDLDTVIVSDDEWMTYTAINVSFTNIPKIDVCPEASLPQIHIIDSAVAGSRIFLATTIGLLDISLDGHGRMTRTLVSTACIQNLKLVNHDYLSHQRVLAIGKMDNTQALLYSNLFAFNTDVFEMTSFYRMSLEQICSRSPDGCAVIDAEYQSIASDHIIILTKHPDNKENMYRLWKYYIDSDRQAELLMEFADGIIKTVRSQHFTLLTEEIRNQVRETIEAKILTLCPDCYNKIEIHITRLYTHVVHSRGLLLLGSHILQGIPGGDFSCISDPHSSHDFTLATSDTNGLVVFYSGKPSKTLWLWMLNAQVLRRIYPSYGWDKLVSHVNESNSEDLMSKYHVISIKFLLSEQLLILLAKDDINQPIIRLLVDVAAVIKSDDVDVGVFSKSLVVDEVFSGDAENHHCLYEPLVFKNDELVPYLRAQHYDWHLYPIPRAFNQYVHSVSDLMIYQLLLYNILRETADVKRSFANISSDFTQSLNSLASEVNLTSFGYGVVRSQDFKDYHKVSIDEHALPDTLYVDKGDEARIVISTHIRSTAANNLYHSLLESIQLSVESSSYDWISVFSRKIDEVYSNRIFFEIRFAVNSSKETKQSISGHNLVPVTLTLRTTVANLHCPMPNPKSTGYTFEGLHSMQLMVGCPPRLRPYFDLEKTIEELEIYETHLNCLNRPERLPCFYFQHDFYPYFGIYDEASGLSRPFTGKYLLRVVGGGTKYERIRKYTTQEIKSFNSFNQSNKELDYLMITPHQYFPGETHNGYPVYTSDSNPVSWHCDVKSDCASPPPAEWGIPEFYFLLEFSNEDVDQSTACKFQFTFVVKVFGHKFGQQDYVVLLTSMLIMMFYVVCYYFWKTRYYWLSKLHHNDNVAIKRFLSLGNIKSVASQASLKKQLLEAIYNDDTYLLSDALIKAETTDVRNLDPPSARNPSITKEVVADGLKRRLEKQIADNNLKEMSFTIAEISKLGITQSVDQSLLTKAKNMLSKKANIVLRLVEAIDSQNYRELTECLTKYKELMPEETTENNPLVKQATVHLTSILTKQLLKSLKKKDTWEIHYAIKEFKNHNINDKFNLIPKAELVIYSRLTVKLRKAIKQGTPNLLRDAITDTERDLDFHMIKDKDGVINEAKTLLSKILKEKLVDEMKKRDSMKIRNAINRFAFYGVTDASGFLEKANKNLYQLVIPPVAKSLDQAKTPEEIHFILTQIKNELNKYGLNDRDKLLAKAEKKLYDNIARQLQVAIKTKAKPKDLAILLTAFVMSKRQYGIKQDLRKLEETAKTMLYRQVVPFLVRALKAPDAEVKQLASAVIAARIEFSKLGIEDPGDIIANAEQKIYDMTFGSLRDTMEYSKDVKVLWAAMKSALQAVKEFNVDDKDRLLMRAENRFNDLIHSEIEEIMQRKDLSALKELKDLVKTVSHPRRLDLLQVIDRNIKDLNAKLARMNALLHSNMTEYKNLCEELVLSTAGVRVTQNIHPIMSAIVKFEKSGFPDNDGVQKAAFTAVAEVVDENFKKYMMDYNFAKVAMLRDVVNSAPMEPKIRDMYYSLSVICGRYLTIKSAIEMALIDKSSELKQYISSLKHIMNSLRILHISLPAYYAESSSYLEGQMVSLMARAEEINSVIIGVDEIKNDLYNVNPMDIVYLEKYSVVPAPVYSVLRAFLLLLGRPPADVERWMDIKSILSNYNSVSTLISDAKAYTDGAVDISILLEVRDLCEQYTDLVIITDESSVSQATTAVILKWVLLVVNESIDCHISAGNDIEKALKVYKSRNRREQEKPVISEIPQSVMLHGKRLNPTEVALTKDLLNKSQQALRKEWTASYLARWIKAYPNEKEAATHLMNSVQFKDSLNVWNLYKSYSAHDPLEKYCGIFEYCGDDFLGKPVFLCQFGKIDLEGLVKSTTLPQFVIHCLFLMELVENLTDKHCYASDLIIDCTTLSQVVTAHVVEAYYWLHVVFIIMSRNYPAMFKNVYVIHASKYKRVGEKFQILLFQSRPGMCFTQLEADSWKEVIYSLVDKSYLPPTLGGSYNVNSHLNSPGKIPPSFYLPELERKDNSDWSKFAIDSTQPKIESFEQKEKVIGALLYCEFECEGVIDFQIYLVPPGVRDIEQKTILLSIKQIDHYYANCVDASLPGVYYICFSTTNWNKKQISYRAQLANSIQQFRDHICHVKLDDNGNIISLMRDSSYLIKMNSN